MPVIFYVASVLLYILMLPISTPAAFIVSTWTRPDKSKEITDELYEKWRDAGLTKLTAKEVEAHLNPKPKSGQVLASQMEEAQTYLDRTDHKFYIGYVPKTDEDCAVIQALRDEKREFIRANE